MIAVTGATGELGQIVIDELLRRMPATEIIAVVRSAEKAKGPAAKGVHLREADYNQPDTLGAAFAGVEKVLLISSNELGRRVAQHTAVINAAKSAGATLIAYTSLLRADTTPLILAKEHVGTERALQASGVPFVLLRNGWYTENFTPGIQPALQQGAFLGASRDGAFSAASRADYAAAAAVVLTSAGHENRTYELAGDTAFTRTQFAAEVSAQTGKNVGYHDLPPAEYAGILKTFLPAELAEILADADAHAAEGALEDSTATLSKLIGRDTTPLAAVVAKAL